MPLPGPLPDSFAAEKDVRKLLHGELTQESFEALKRAIGNRIETRLSGGESRLVYLAEKVWLQGGSHGETPDRRDMEFVRFLAKSLFGADPGLKEEALESMLRDMERAAEHPDRERWEALNRLLEEDLQRIRSPAGCGHSGVERQGALVILPAKGRLHVAGDLHGDFLDSTRNIVHGFREELASLRLSDGGGPFFVFLGDYVNNGLNSVDTLLAVLKLRSEFPDRVLLLGGNHELNETYRTALKEFFVTHWNNARLHASKSPPLHYGHFRLELARRFGPRRCESLSRAFEAWGRSLPLAALSRKGILMSHSLGLPSGRGSECESAGKLRAALANAKQDPGDVRLFHDLGYEAWKKKADTVHARMVMNRRIRPDLLRRFRVLEVRSFIVGHTHFRSGDIHRTGNTSDGNDVGAEGVLLTLCTSGPESPEAGHYIEHEFAHSRTRQGEGRRGRARACRAVFDRDRVRRITNGDLRFGSAPCPPFR